MLSTFEPVYHLGTRWPDWQIIMGTLDDGETHAIYPHARMLFINPVGISPLLAIAHGVAHLELGHHLTPDEGLTGEQCAEASIWAGLMVPESLAAQWPQWNVEVGNA